MGQTLIHRHDAPMKWVKYSTPAWLLWTELGWLTLDITKDGYAIMALLPAPTLG